MTYHRIIAATAALAAVALPASAAANTANSIAPAHIYYGTVHAGQHPNRVATLHNGTGRAQTIRTVAISGSGGYVFTLVSGTRLLRATGLPRCRPGLTLAPGARCAMDVRVHTVRQGWWRSTLRVVYQSRWFNSAELRAHVVEAAS